MLGSGDYRGWFKERSSASAFELRQLAPGQLSGDQQGGSEGNAGRNGRDPEDALGLAWCPTYAAFSRCGAFALVPACHAEGSEGSAVCSPFDRAKGTHSG